MNGALSGKRMKEIASLFRQLRAQAAKRVPDLVKVSLAVKPGLHDSPRHFAMTDGKAVLIAPELAREPRAVQRGVLAHELGHASRMLSGEQASSYDAEERAADTEGEWLTGVTISYDHRGVETTGSGTRPRPRGLR